MKDAQTQDKLHDAVKNYFVESDFHFGDSYRIVVRAFAHSEADLADKNVALFTWACVLSSVDQFFDAVVVPNGDAVERKIVGKHYHVLVSISLLTFVEGAFEAADKDRSCKHVFVAASQRPAYSCVLKEANDKKTMFEGAAVKEGCEVFDLPAPFTSFPQVFRDPSEHTSTSRNPYLRVLETEAEFVDRRPFAVSEVCSSPVHMVSVLTCR